MAEPLISEALLTRLRQVDTPTVCNAIEVAQGKRGFDAFTRRTMICTAPESPAVVGYACTAQIRAATPTTDPIEVVRERRMAYYRAMAEAPRPTVAVIEDLDDPDCVGAWWGEVNATVHQSFGLAGALTNGLVRDLGEMQADFPIIAGGIGPSHAFVHVTAIGGPVAICGMTVNEGDLIHADRHGAAVIPPEALPTLEAAIDRLLASEALILGPAREPGFDMAKFEAAWAAFEASRT